NLPYVLSSALSRLMAEKVFLWSASCSTGQKARRGARLTIIPRARYFSRDPALQSSPRSSQMTSPFSVRLQFIVVGLCAFLFREAAAQNQPSYLQLSPTVKAVLYSPSSSFTARVPRGTLYENGNRFSHIAFWGLLK